MLPVLLLREERGDEREEEKEKTSEILRGGCYVNG